MAQAFLIGRDFIAGERSALVLGDNIFYGRASSPHCGGQRKARRERLSSVIGCATQAKYGVLDLAPDGSVRAIVEKPTVPPSNYAVTGLYFYDGQVADIL